MYLMFMAVALVAPVNSNSNFVSIANYVKVGHSFGLQTHHMKSL